MPFHFCSDELLLILSMLPFIGVFFRKIHAWWHAQFSHQEHKHNEPIVHVIETGPLRSPLEVLENPPKFNPPPFDLLK